MALDGLVRPIDTRRSSSAALRPIPLAPDAVSRDPGTSLFPAPRLGEQSHAHFYNKLVRRRWLRRASMANGCVVLMAVLVITFLSSGQSEPLHATPDASLPEASVAVETSDEGKTRPGEWSLQIPAIDVDAPVDRVGLTPAGAVAVPWSIFRAGLYEHAALPGSGGTVFLTGHYGALSQHKGVFIDLGDLKAGERVNIHGKDGDKQWSYTVQTNQTFARDRVPLSDFAKGSHRLVIVSCAGQWLSDEQDYTERRIVVAQLEP